MPLYEYKCSKCDEIFEVIQKFSDAPLKKHAGCGGKVAKVLSAPAFQLKGTGWYATDYKKASSGKADSSGESKGETKTETKTESAGGKDAPAAAESKTESTAGKPAKTETTAKKE